METFVTTDYEPKLLEVTLTSQQRVKADLVVSNPYLLNTQFTNRDMWVQGNKTFFVRMPITPKSVKVFSTANIVSTKLRDLPRKFTEYDIQNYNLKNFVRFAQEFCAKCGYLKSNKQYGSDNGIFTIKYFEIIRDDNGNEDATPCRINKYTGVMEVSARRFRQMTVPMRFALLLHEYCHFWKNVDPNSEFQSDKNSLFVYLGLGFPRFEAYEIWIRAFDKTPTANGEPSIAHKKRLAQIRNIIDTYDKKFGEVAFIK